MRYACMRVCLPMLIMLTVMTKSLKTDQKNSTGRLEVSTVSLLGLRFEKFMTVHARALDSVRSSMMPLDVFCLRPFRGHCAYQPSNKFE